MNQTTVEHPHWCDPAACTITPAAAAGEAHQGRPVTVVAAHGIATPLRVTASLYQPAAWPLAGPFVTLEVDGLACDGWRSVAGTTQVAAEHAATLGAMLLDLATAAGAAAGPSASGTPRAVLRPDHDVIDLVGRGGRVPVTFAEARDIEDQISAILTIFTTEPGDRAGSESINAILANEDQVEQQHQSDAPASAGGPDGLGSGGEVDR